MSCQYEVFISYSSRDVNRQILEEVANLLKSLGRPFVDALTPPAVDPQAAVERALVHVSSLCIVSTPSYLTTEWTRFELSCALNRGIDLYQINPERMNILSLSRKDAISLLKAKEIEHEIVQSGLIGNR